MRALLLAAGRELIHRGLRKWGGHPGRRQKVFAFPPERCSPSERNAVRIHNGMVVGFRTESRSPSTGFPT